MKIIHLFLLSSLISGLGFTAALAAGSAPKTVTLVDAGKKYVFKEHQGVLFSAQNAVTKSFQPKLAQIKPVTPEKAGEILNPAAQFCELYLGHALIWKDLKGSEYDVCKIGDNAFVTSWSAFEKWRSIQK